jgi:hypothetical protein
MSTEADKLNLAVQLTGVEAKWLQAFEVADHLNDGLALSGYLCQRPDHRYGALALLEVGGTSVPQLILATPKLHYPFDRAGTFRFPAVRRIHLYEKLDGTNVLAYRYRDGDGAWHLSYKLRLSAVLRNSKWGEFLDLWQEILRQHPALPRLVELNDCYLSFELYGGCNTHLIVYEAELSVAVLFGVRRDGSVVPPHQLELLGVPAAPLVGELTAEEDPVGRYAQLRAEMERRNRKTEDDKLTGTEGLVWYVEQPNGTVTLFKCKPESMEEIHWTTGINKQAVFMTCWNLLETQDELAYDTLLPLLLKEYGAEEIERFRAHIEACVAEVCEALAFRERVLEEYLAVGLSILTHKAEVMRALSARFARAEMKSVYSIITRHVG